MPQTTKNINKPQQPVQSPKANIQVKQILIEEPSSHYFDQQLNSREDLSIARASYRLKEA
jgi:hypothetical protein